MTYESPIEERMGVAMAKAFHPGVTIETQRKVAAHGEKFRLDFHVEYQGTRLAVECDGKDYHEYHRDRRRDLLTIDSGAVTDVFRLRGTDIVYDAEACVTYMRSFFPSLFEADATRVAIGDLLDWSCLMYHGCIKPIARMTFSADEIRDNSRLINSGACCATDGLLLRDGSFGIVTFKTPDWDWKGHKENMLIKTFADVLDPAPCQVRS